MSTMLAAGRPTFSRRSALFSAVPAVGVVLGLPMEVACTGVPMQEWTPYGPHAKYKDHMNPSQFYCKSISTNNIEA